MSLLRPLTCLALCALLTTLPLHASAAAKRHAKGTRLKPSPTVQYASGETGQQYQLREERRLRRECRGRPNAGACAGYAF